MSLEKRRKKYQVFTPIDTVKKMLDEINYEGNTIIDKTIVDISCGNGAFLTEALRRYIQACRNSGVDEEKIAKMAVSHIFGYENDEAFYKECQLKMNNVLKKELDTNRGINFKNIRCLDGLTIDGIAFDYVVGNPPYLSYKEMNEEQREFLQLNFETCKEQKYDYSYAFIEKSIKLLKNDGVACIIAPINMYKIKSGKLMRAFLRSRLYKIFDVTEDNIFKGVLTNPVISLFKPKVEASTICIVKRNIDKTVAFDEFYTNDKQTNQNDFKGKRFGDYYSVHNGVATLLNSAFIVPEGTDIESGVLKNACSPKEIRYGTKKRIIFPYKHIDGSIKKYEEIEFKNLFPKAYAYLSKNKDALEKRDRDVSAKWFEYGRSQAISIILSKKILVPAIMSENMKLVLLGTDDVVYAGFFIIPNEPNEHSLEEALRILSNKKLYHYIQQVGVKMNGKSYRYSVKDLENYRY